ncbi:DNA polymerase IV [Pontibacter sp. G13]|uniref:DNA polymerase IV n=1 Tax=Pontibacter sp. G13 TaxID=3074898 RepID=UPI00288A73ED|nr:DNA polymerase IV [Pontibacter sp. G13]WNJ18615.1 DNA polymerase IV [Pontibacter sp. G13]
MSGVSPIRSIVHMDLDTFFVSVERLKDSRLNGLPLLIGGTGDRAVVSSCSYEARTFGIRSGMPMRMARRMCPQAITISGDFEAYSQYSGMVSEIVAESSPLYEKASIDEFYIDMTGMDRYFGCYKWAGELRQRIIHETGLPISFGLSVNKLVSKVATGEAKPNGQLQIPFTNVQQFLEPMPVFKIPMIGPKLGRTLTYMGVPSVGKLRQIPKPVLERAFGKTGIMLFRKARGEDDAPVTPHHEAKSMSTERTFQTDTMDVKMLRSLVTRMAEQLAFRLRDDHKLCACVAVKIRYANFETVSKQLRIPYSARDEELIPLVLRLFEQLYQKRVRVRLVGVKFSQLVSGRPQLNMFQDMHRQADLYDALDAIKHKYGKESIGKASGWVPPKSP